LRRCRIRELRIHAALPVQVTWAQSGQATRQNAYTLDVSRSGARLAGVKGLTDPGQLIAVRRKTSEARFRVVWIGQPHTPQEGQIGVECIDPDKIIWDVDFAKVHEDFEVLETANSAAWAPKSSSGVGTKLTDLPCPGKARVWREGVDSDGIEARLTSIDLSGCRLDGDGLPVDRPLVLQLAIGEVQITVKGSRSRNDQRIVFTHIRRGDHHLLEGLISRLSVGKRP
jgi:hypothetical protein